eukprot:scaffold208620_cov21-Tisochrysis_lutea.AAC.2
MGWQHHALALSLIKAHRSAVAMQVHRTLCNNRKANILVSPGVHELTAMRCCSTSFAFTLVYEFSASLLAPYIDLGLQAWEWQMSNRRGPPYLPQASGVEKAPKCMLQMQQHPAILVLTSLAPHFDHPLCWRPTHPSAALGPHGS